MTAEEHLARRLAHDHGHLIDDTDWEHTPKSLRRDYLALATATFAVLGGPTEAQQEAARLAAEVRELRRQRDRYREAWQSACRRASGALRAARGNLDGPEKGPVRPPDGRAARKRPGRSGSP
ncbi:hypothetical protein [Streptomyces sp. NPDC001652]|uniref:hypothetical protein n=1 Tax=Streptomyces sp. NPDC001652 TaxID=3154393 RepID=UPI0033331531